MLRRSMLLALAMIPLGSLVSPAGMLTPGDILVSSTTDLATNVIREYTPSGTLVQTFNIPNGINNGTPDSYIRDLVADGKGNVQIYNGTFSPTLTTLNPLTGGTTNNAGVGFSTVNNIYYGGISVSGNYAYVTDMNTANSPASGIVRFNLTDGTSVRFGTLGNYTLASTDYISLAAGLDGKIYALSPGGSPRGFNIDVYDPATLALTRSLQFYFGTTYQLNGLAVAASGDIYAVGALSDGHLYHFSAAGALLGSFATGFTGLNGLQLSNSGQLLMASNNGQIISVDTGFAHETSFSVGSEITTFAAFVTNPTAVPEPTSFALLGLGGIALVGLGRRRKSAA